MQSCNLVFILKKYSWNFYEIKNDLRENFENKCIKMIINMQTFSKLYLN